MSCCCLTCDDLWTLEVLVGVQIAGRQSEPQPDDQEKQVCAAPHVDLDFFLEIPAQASARPYRGFQGGVLDRGQAGCIRHIVEGRGRGKVRRVRRRRDSRRRNEQALDRLISKFVYENVRSLSSDEATCLGDRVEWTGLSWQPAGVVAGQSNASEPSAGGRGPGEIIAGSPPSRASSP